MSVLSTTKSIMQPVAFVLLIPNMPLDVPIEAEPR